MSMMNLLIIIIIIRKRKKKLYEIFNSLFKRLKKSRLNFQDSAELLLLLLFLNPL